MPWAGPQFRAAHNRGIGANGAAKAARIATGMVKAGVPEGDAIATANARAEGKPRKAKAPGFRGKKTRSYVGA